MEPFKADRALRAVIVISLEMAIKLEAEHGLEAFGALYRVLEPMVLIDVLTYCSLGEMLPAKFTGGLFLLLSFFNEFRQFRA